MKTITLRKYENRYRSVEVKLESFPAEVQPRNYSLFGYLCGERVNRSKDLNIFDFDTIVYLKNSRNAKNEIEYVHCLGHRSGSDFLTPIVLKKKN